MKIGMILLATILAASAQDRPDFSGALPAVPKPPVRWVVEFTYPPRADGVGRRPSKTTVDHTKSATRVVETMTDGSSTERWFSQGFEITRVPGSPEVVVIPPEMPSDPNSADYLRVFFPRLGWVGENAYQGREKRDGKEAYLFEGPYGTASTQQAFLSAETLLPMAIASPSVTMRYSFLPPESVELPADFRTALETYRSQLRAAMKPVGSR